MNETLPDPDGGSSPPVLQGIRARTLAAVLLAIGILGATSGYWLTRVGSVPAGIVGASLAVLLVPGAVVALAWRPREWTLYDLLGMGLAVSIVLVQLGTVAAIVLHVPIDAVAAGLGLVTVAHALAAFRSRRVVVPVCKVETVLGLALLVVGACLYVIGSPVDSHEDVIHIALVRRLAHLQAPSLENLYVVSGVTYTYPFPGTHYFMALVSHLSGLDPLFVYHKLRVIWGPAALVLLYACARRVFENRAQALAAGFVAVAFVLNGSFAAVPDFYWGQLAPYSHASDVAMGVLLPALLLSALQAQLARSAGAFTFFILVTAGLVVTLTMVHIREIAQFIVYVGAFTLALLITRADRRSVTRAAALLALSVAVPLVYDAWHARAVTDVEAAVQLHRDGLLKTAAQTSFWGWLQPSNLVVSGYVEAFGPTFYGWNPLVLFGGAALVASLRTQGMLLIGASVLAYALILRIGALGWAYVFATYFEILYTPARNTIFFVHLLAGALVYALSTAIARLRALVAVAATAAAAAGLVVGYKTVGPVTAAYNDLFWVPLVLAYAVAIGAVGRRQGQTTPGASVARGAGTAVAIAAVLVGAAIAVSWDRSVAPIPSKDGPAFSTPPALLTGLGCRQSGGYQPDYAPPGAPSIDVPGFVSCPPPLSLMEFAASALPADAVLASDKFDDYPPPVFLPQQVVSWPGTGDGLLNQRALFRPYFRFFDAAVLKHGGQPFFNGVDTEEERRSFLDGLRVTHILLNPRLRAVMLPVLASRPERYRSRFDDGQWAIFEVVR